MTNTQRISSLFIAADIIILYHSTDFRMIAYVDEVACIVKGKFLDTIYEYTQAYLKLVANWAERSIILRFQLR